MRKKSLIYLHQLFTEVRHEFEARDIVRQTVFREYDSCSHNCTHIHHGKATHKEAVFLLADGLAEPEETRATEQTEPPLPS